MSTVTPQSQDYLVRVTHQFIDSVGLKIAKSELRESLLSHPNYPTLFALTDSLTRHKVPNKAVRISLEHLKDMPKNWFAQLIGQGLVFVKNVDESSIHYFSEQSGWITESLIDFGIKWSGIAIFPDWKNAKRDLPPTQTYWTQELGKIRNNLSLVLIIGLVILLGWQLKNWQAIGFWLSSIVGFSVSILLVFKNLNREWYQKYCHIGKTFDCNTVLDSPYAKVGKWLSLTDLSITYFSTALFLLATTAICSFSVPLWLLSGMGLASIVAVFYSLYIQGIVLKKWCPFCLVIAGTLFIQFLFSIGWLMTSPSMLANSTEWWYTLSLSIAPALMWSYVKPIINDLPRSETYKFQLNRLKSSRDVFEQLQSVETELTLDWPTHSIQLGDATASDQLNLVLSPNCQHCTTDFTAIYEWLKSNGKGLGIRIVLQAGFQNQFISGKFLELSQQGVDVTEILYDWFISKNTEAVKEQYGHELTATTKDLLVKQNQWLQASNISTAPGLFFNRRKLSKYYSVKDVLQYFTTH